jgi:hypothetical protein
MKAVAENFTEIKGIKNNRVFNEERRMDIKARTCLIIVWVSAISVCLFFILFSFIPQPMQSFMAKNSLLSKLQKNFLPDNSFQLNGNSSNLWPDNNNAFVFVNINKKFFLTRFPSGRSFAQTPSVNNKAAAINLPHLKESMVIRKVKASTKNLPDKDFSIKPVPQ